MFTGVQKNAKEEYDMKIVTYEVENKTKLGIFAAGVGALLFVLGLLIGAVANRD